MDRFILHLDNHLLVVVKPAGLLVQGDATGDEDLLTLGKRYLKERFDRPGNVFLGLVHRLDRPASGVLVLARTSKAASRLSQQFRERSPSKRYLAIAEGRLKGEGEREDHLARANRTTFVVPREDPRGKPARMRWRAIATAAVKGVEVSLIEVDLITGRAHQIRAQLAAMGHPILGDLRYGAKHEFDGRNLALHSHSLTIEHPTLREEMTFRAKPPSTWAGYFEDLVDEIVSAE